MIHHLFSIERVLPQWIHRREIFCSIIFRKDIASELNCRKRKYFFQRAPTGKVVFPRILFLLLEREVV
jgi:hypothetical protein